MPVITKGIHKQLVCVCACVCVCVSACMYYKPKLPLKNALGVTLTLSRLKPCPRPVFISGITLRQTTWNTAATKSGCCKTFLTSLSVADFHGNNCIVSVDSDPRFIWLLHVIQDEVVDDCHLKQHTTPYAVSPPLILWFALSRRHLPLDLCKHNKHWCDP